MYQEYTTFFEKAERERRWNVFDDIPWDKVNKDASEELALCAETFCGVEMYLPDYVAGGINVVRKCFGQAWFQANWAYEESKHALALTEYLMRSGKRTDEQMIDFQNADLREGLGAAVQHAAPDDALRRRPGDGDVRHLLEAARPRARRAMRGAAQDLRSHRARRDRPLPLLPDGRQGAARRGPRRDARRLRARVRATSRCRASRWCPTTTGASRSCAQAGIDRAVFMQKVYFPILKYLGITRQDLVHAAKRNAGQDAPAASGVVHAGSHRTMQNGATQNGASPQGQAQNDVNAEGDATPLARAGGA